MSRASTLMVLGVLVILTPFSGFPTSMRSFFDLLLGLCVFTIGLLLRTRQVRTAIPEIEVSAPTAPSTAPETHQHISAI
jgi:hypothetical protein